MSQTNGRHSNNGAGAAAAEGRRLGRADAVPARIVIVRGTSGYVDGHEVRVGYGRSITVGRSRSADLSLQRCDRFLEAPDPEADDFLRVSRLHVEVSYLHPRMIEIRNVGRNGVRVEGRAVDRVLLTDLDRPVVIEFGAEERLEVAWGTVGRSDATIASDRARSPASEDDAREASDDRTSPETKHA